MPDTIVPAPSHAGGVVFRRFTNNLEYLLVRARKPPEAWVFPKGHIEEGETPQRAAVREVIEEAGVRTVIVTSLGGLQFDSQYAEMFLMAYESEGDSSPERECVWLGFDAALGRLSFQESQDLLRKADHVVRTLP